MFHSDEARFNVYKTVFGTFGNTNQNKIKEKLIENNVMKINDDQGQI